MGKIKVHAWDILRMIPDEEIAKIAKDTPSKVHLEQGIQQKMWKKKIYTSKKKDS